MPKLHVIYDPHDKIQTNSEQEKYLDLKVAVLHLHEDLNSKEIVNYAQQLASLLLEQI